MSGRAGVGERIGWFYVSFFLIVIVFTLLISVLFVGRGEGAVITVDDDPGGGDFQRIQTAIDVAEDGDTIRVFDGEYNGKLIVDKSIALIGNGSRSTTIDADIDNFFDHRCHAMRVMSFSSLLMVS